MNQEIIFKMLENKQKSLKWLFAKLVKNATSQKKFYFLLQELVKKGQIFITKDNHYFRPKTIKTTQGEIKITSKNYGFIQLEKDNSIFIAQTSLNNVLDGDIVEVNYFQEKNNDLVGTITKIITRNKQFLVGVIKFQNQKWLFLPFNPRIKANFSFLKKGNLKPKLNVKVKIIAYKSNYILIDVIEVIGYTNDIKTIIKTAIIDSGINYKWNKIIQFETTKITKQINESDYKQRQDLRDQLIFTIDGENTKDFDDAIDVSMNKKQNFVLRVHIADVAHYVKANSAIDKEALLRGTSHYLVNEVIPMLPEVLTNDICSLKPNQDRLTISLQIEINPQGKIIGYDIFPSVINSKFRLTYHEVNQTWENKKEFKPIQLNNSLKLARQLAQILKKENFKRGYLDFEIAEPQFVLNQKNEVEEIKTKSSAEAEKMIEVFMILANQIIAEHFQKNNLPMIYRIHPKPESSKLARFQTMINLLKIDVDIPMVKTSIKFAQTIKQIKQYRFDNLVKSICLKTMSKAIYYHNNLGHFGLGLKHYTHFTSPIRRYCDLLVQRILHYHLFKSQKITREYSSHDLVKIAEQCSELEQRAVKLNYRIVNIRQAQYYSRFIKKQFKGIIVEIKSFGFFVQLPDQTNALVARKALSSDEYEFDASKLQLIGVHKTFAIGDIVDVIVSKTLVSEGKIDLVLADNVQ